MPVPDLRRTAALPLSACLALAALGAVFAVSPAAAAEPSSSARTVSAKDYDPDYQDSPFPDLKVTVSQTQDLIQQGITVSWTGGKQSAAPTQQTGGTNYLQIAQCWGDEAGSDGTRPDRTTCQYGGVNLPGATRYSNRNTDTEAAEQDASYTAKGAGWWEPSMTAVPFNAATGESIASVVDGKRVENPPDLDNNEFFTKYTTNEVSWAPSGSDGSGLVNFELQTVQQSPGLGCGKATTTGGVTTGASCWLVIIPRGTVDGGGTGITQSGLFWETWKHHLAIRLEFKPTGLSCALGAAERQLSGSELISGAVGQWQPRLCNSADGAVYSLLTGPESDAALAANGTASAPLAITSRALSTEDATDHLTYAPVALTGISVAFAVDRDALTDAPDSVLAKNGLPLTSLRLTPRLLAKLLTASYTDALPQASDKSHLSGPRNLTKDPDFLAINDPEWRYLGIASVGVSDALTPLGRSDTAQAIWTYILADADARAFLSGKPDPWGMRVNPYYSTSAKVNPNRTALALPRSDFPKADPVEYEGTAGNSYADAVNLVTWRPFTASLDAGGYDVLRGDPLKLGAWDPTATPAKYGKGERSLVGSRGVLGLTDTSAAAKYQVFEAALRNPAGAYVAPTSASLTAAAAAMVTDTGQSQVVHFDPASRAAAKAKAAYPLAMPVYAAVNPAMGDADVRADYANFITYAVTDGQTPGTDDGELPDGYAPLPASWKKQARAAAAAIKNGSTATPTATASPSPTTAASGSNVDSTSGSASSGSSNPAASGDPAGSLTGSQTPADPGLGPLTAVVPATAALGAVAALGVPLVSRLRRRRP